MKRECAQPGSAEISSAHVIKSTLKERYRKPFAVIAAIGSLALGYPTISTGESSVSSPRTVHLAKPMQYVGFNSSEILNEDPEAANAEGQRIAAAGGNIVRIQVPYTVGGAEVNNDINRLCNAAKAATDNGLTLEITMAGHMRNGDLGYFASSAGEDKRVETAIFNMLSRLAKEPSTPGGGDGGCTPELKSIDIGFNEPNNPAFMKAQSVGGKWTAPEKEVNLLDFLNKNLREDMLQAGIKTSLNLIGGELRARDAVSFIKAMGKIIKAKRIKIPFNVFSFHEYYGNTSTSGVDSFSSIVAQIRQTFGNDMPIRVNEVGAYSETPADMADLYNVPLPSSVKPLSGAQQGQYYNNVIKQAACLGVNGVEIFHQSDDPNDVLRTGTNYPNDQPKPSAPVVSQAFNNARSGNISC